MNHIHKSWDNMRYSGSAKNCPAWPSTMQLPSPLPAKSTCVISFKSLQHFSPCWIWYKTEKSDKPETRHKDLLCWRRGTLTVTNKLNFSVMKDTRIMYKILLGAMKLKLPNHLAMTCDRRNRVCVLNSCHNYCFSVSCLSAVIPGEPWILPYACVSRAEVFLSSSNSHP